MISTITKSVSTFKSSKPDYRIELTDTVKKDIWLNSKWREWINTSNAHKGKTGVDLVIAYYLSIGVSAVRINRNGDVLVSTKIGEVKTGKLLANGELWFNQIRPRESAWAMLYLVGVLPKDIIIWAIPREDAIKLADGFSHVGQKGLLAVKGNLQDLAYLNEYILTRITDKEITVV